ncbi:GNAT family N-acetyltransferase [Ammoniphilus resinae]|uniref:Phosphinothricin acetyltransferase n=1 Tax=Ammoniphilus resinae TaxID=861532 RepID=A0ABS4GVL3_9BACL|nr:GNAT family N-acetyltransferase [Ammoniphilus resinae]MBP1934137.1 phosphinothricin acetyltransferase [Ammoniphilus resinae]
MYQIRDFLKEDWNQVKFIYEAGIATGHATFETRAPSFDHWIASAVPGCTLVAFNDKAILGWCKLSAVSDRCVYSGVAEVSIYVHPDAQGKGVGNLLLEALIKRSEEKGFWTLQAGIFPENTSSLALHEKHGFREIGRRERIGKMHGKWRDTILLERRSRVVGVE